MWDPSSLTRGQTHAACMGTVACQLLDHQGNPRVGFFRNLCLVCEWLLRNEIKKKKKNHGGKKKKNMVEKKKKEMKYFLPYH